MTQLPDWPRAWGKPSARAIIRRENADFQVEEIAVIEPDGAGEHVWLWVEKNGQNTAWVAEQIARSAGLPARAVSFAGQKDRHAITRQYFSVHLPGREWAPETANVFTDEPGVKLLEWARHSRKLKRGGLKGNRFRLHLRMDSSHQKAIEERLNQISVRGVPNYFGEQRFGRQGANISAALQLFQGRRFNRNKRAMMLSAARSWLFNQILAQRVLDNSWDTLLPGEIAIIDGRRQRFPVAGDDSEAFERCARGEIHPSGLLYGDGDNSEDECAAMEKAMLAKFPEWTQGLDQARLQADRRALRLLPKAMDWNWDDTGLTLQFELPAGAYATAVLRELVNYSNPHDCPAGEALPNQDKKDNP